MRTSEGLVQDIDEEEAIEVAAADIDGGTGSSDSDSESDSSDGLSRPVEYLLDLLETDIQCLVDLGPRYKEPVQDSIHKEISAPLTETTNRSPESYMTDRILEKYPNIDSDLASTLGKSRWDRRQTLYQMTMEAGDIAGGQQPIEEATAKYMATVAPSNRDSGLGTSIATRYAETLLSSHAARGSWVKFPEVHPEGLLGKPFGCGICGATVVLPPPPKAETIWKKHVISDLQPYTCIVSTCEPSRTPMADIRAFSNHLSSEHGISDSSGAMACPICQESLEGGKIRHIADHLEDISLCIVPAAVSEDGLDSEAEDEVEDDAEHESLDYKPCPLPQTPSHAPSATSAKGAAHEEPVWPEGHGPQTYSTAHQDHAPPLGSLGPAAERTTMSTESKDCLPIPNWTLKANQSSISMRKGTGMHTLPQPLPYPAQAHRPSGPELVFSCSHDNCDKAFPKACDLKKHERNHTKPIKCDLCSRFFVETKARNGHLWARHPEYAVKMAIPSYRVSCPVKPCPYVGRGDNVQRHMRAAHGNVYINWKAPKGYETSSQAKTGQLEDSPKVHQSPIDSLQGPVYSGIRDSKLGIGGDAPSPGDRLGPKIWTGTHFLPRFVKAAEIPGEGTCYFYDDGTHCKTVIDGEAVDAHWGVTTDGKPRKRLSITCITCRERKIKCDPDYPRCMQCKKFDRVCTFKNLPRQSLGMPPRDSDEQRQSGEGPPRGESKQEADTSPSSSHGGGSL
ncbi:hypothetical protein B0T14DRAFT_272904 [Immersiella caudata]|uniref:Zn(2)-C6 fungal-type domain-containing protein n=1 Tax=Immersiella caudata TaxID=314043 RepID=A0AA39WLE2_9PEZI|nr:hypothetical protein B0T14DRAFT_272904 [Immersiella caudata]